MLSFTVRMRFDSADHEEIASILRLLTAGSREEPGCVSYVPHFLEDDANTVLIYEQYIDEAALEAHRQTPHFKEFAIGGLYQKMRERSIETLHAIC